MFKQSLKKLAIVNRVVAVVIVAMVMLLATFSYNKVRADQYDQQIQGLKDQNSGLQAQSNSLAATAASYEQAVDALGQQINSLQQAIVSTQNQIDSLQKQIDQAQAQLDQEKRTLGEDIKTMYLEGQISTLEILASSNNLSDYVNKQEYRSTVQDKVKDSVDKINALKVELQRQQFEQQSLLKDQQTQQSQLQASEDQQAALLNYTEAQKATFDTQIKSNNAQISSLRAAQASANRQLGGVPVSGDPNHGGYPTAWANAPQDTLIDSWGMFNRECVSYTAWKVYQTYGYMPYWGGVGNANQWPADARAAGIPTGTTPRVNSVAIWYTASALGHAMWVEGVNGNTIYVSQYNYDGAGHYSEMSINGSGLTYIYFGS